MAVNIESGSITHWTAQPLNWGTSLSMMADLEESQRIPRENHKEISMNKNHLGQVSNSICCSLL